MSGIALLRLLKPLDHYKKKYHTPFYGLDKMYLLMEKQHNRGQDGAGLASIKFDMEPGERFMSRARSKAHQPIQDVFATINNRINEELKKLPENYTTQELKEHIPYVGELFLGHVLYATKGKSSIESVHPFLRKNNWMHRNLILAGNFNLTNVPELFDHLVDLGQHPKEKSDAVTILEKIGHFLDMEVEQLYLNLKNEGINKREASGYIAEKIKVDEILRNSSKDFDGGYAIAGLLGHGDSFVIRDPWGIRPVFYYMDDEFVVATSERAALQTTFNLRVEQIKELPAGCALITKRNGVSKIHQVLPPQKIEACSFESIYFSRGNDAKIYQERKDLGKAIFPKVLKAIDYDTINSVFSYIPNTAETSFWGMLEGAQDELNRQKKEAILEEQDGLTEERLTQILSHRIRTEKIAVKDVKLRTFITQGSNRDDLVSHVYDVTYGVIKPTDNLVIIDDSIVRGTTLKKSILGMLDRLHPKKIIVISSAPQIRYPDCYGIDMPDFNNFIAFHAALELLKDHNQYHIVDEIYQKCLRQTDYKDQPVENLVKAIYEPFTDEDISNKIAEMLARNGLQSELKIIFQTVEDLHKACPANLGDWYFTGNYPTPGGNKAVNRAFIDFYENENKAVY